MSDILTFVEKLPKLPIENPPLLILLHGYGSNELDLFSFANELPDSLVIVGLWWLCMV
jgi:phospholipase/carboxylesterase